MLDCFALPQQAHSTRARISLARAYKILLYVMAEPTAAKETTGVTEKAAEGVPEEEEWRVQAEAFKNEGSRCCIIM